MLKNIISYLLNLFSRQKVDLRVPADPKDQVVNVPPKDPVKLPVRLDQKYIDAPHMLDVEADLKLNIKEAPGSANNPIIVSWFDVSGLAKKYWHDSTSWCGVYVNAKLRRYFPASKLAKNPAWAADWLKVGKKLLTFKFGCVMVVKSDYSNSGYHVTFGYGIDGDYYLGAGGNQGNAMNVTKYHKSKVAAFIWIA